MHSKLFSYLFLILMHVTSDLRSLIITTQLITTNTGTYQTKSETKYPVFACIFLPTPLAVARDPFLQDPPPTIILTLARDPCATPLWVFHQECQVKEFFEMVVISCLALRKKMSGLEIPDFDFVCDLFFRQCLRMLT